MPGDPDGLFWRIRGALDAVLTEDARRWLAAGMDRVAGDGDALFALSPAAGRSCGRGPLVGVPGWTVDQAVRARLLLAVNADPRPLGTLLFEVYRYGDAGERLAVLKALELLDRAKRLMEYGLPVVRDALRTSDTRLIEAAVGPYAGEWLPEDEYRQAVLKCVLAGVSLNSVAGLRERTDRELARMLAGYAHERLVAGRDVPMGIWPVVQPYREVLTDVYALLRSESGGSRRAAWVALSGRVAALNESKGDL